MKPKRTAKQELNLFQSRLDQIINMDHALVKLANEIEWSTLEEKFGKFYEERMGRPALATRLMVGLHYLKAMFNESDESVVDRFVENPYWQYFCGYEFFLHEAPLDPTSLVKWRNRIGADGAEKMLKETVEVAKKTKQIRPQEMKRINVDTTVQEKAIAYPTDAELYCKMRQKLVDEAQERGICLRQTYDRVGKKALVMQYRYRHARQMKKAKREVRRLKTYLGRVMRDIERKALHIDEALKAKLAIARRIFTQKRDDSNKVYSIHAPEVECIAKGKAHKKYEFGCKVSVVSTSRNNWVIGVQAHHGNPYDGHTLESALAQAEQITEMKCGDVYCDRGYRGVIKALRDRSVTIAHKMSRLLSKWERKWIKRRSAIEPIVGHMKQDNGMERNHLLGKEGDKINAVLAGCGFNLRKLLRVFFCHIFRRLLFGLIERIRSNKTTLATDVSLPLAA